MPPLFFDRVFPEEPGHDERGEDEDCCTARDTEDRDKKSDHSKNGIDQGPADLAPDPVLSEIRDKFGPVVPDIVPLGECNDADDEDIDFKEHGAEGVERIVAGNVRCEWDEADESKARNVEGEERAVEVNEVAEALVLEVPEEREDDERDEVVEQIGQDIRHDGLDRFGHGVAIVLGWDADGGDEQRHGECVDGVDDIADPFLGDEMVIRDGRGGHGNTRNGHWMTGLLKPDVLVVVMRGGFSAVFPDGQCF